MEIYNYLFTLFFLVSAANAWYGPWEVRPYERQKGPKVIPKIKDFEDQDSMEMNPLTMCTDAVYIDAPPYEKGVPYAAGTCEARVPQLAKCSSIEEHFPKVAGNVSFIMIPRPFNYQCTFYTNMDCRQTQYTRTVPGPNHLATDQLRDAFDKKIVTYGCLRAYEIPKEYWDKDFHDS